MSNEYYVGTGQPYSEIQEAISALIADQGTDDFTSEQRITVVTDGVYQPFQIPSDALRPTSAARLIIQSAIGIQATISGLKNPKKYAYGCLVGNNVPYVSIRRMFFRNLKRGVVVGVNSHRAILDQCTIFRCGNAGVWFYQAEECAVANSAFINNDHAIVCSQTKSLAVLCNTLFNDSGFSDIDPWLIYADLQDDRGQGVEDTGTLTIKGNILFSQAGGGLLMYEKDVTHLDSDYNDWWSPGSGPITEIREHRPDGTVARDQITKLALLKLRTGTDDYSLSEEPGFIKPQSSSTSATIDLDLLKNSDLVGKGKKFTADDLPDYVDASLVATDFNGITRATNATIGANEVSVKPSFYGHEVFSEDSDETATTSDGDFAAFDKAAGQYAAAVPLWYPKVHSGHFYVRDEQYYLYADKVGVYLKDCHFTTFPLTVPLVQVSEVIVSGEDVTSDSDWFSEGLTFTLKHSTETTIDGDTEVEVRGYYNDWSQDDLAFVRKHVRHRWKVREGGQRYALPTNPVPGAPIVITDDTINPLDTLGLAQEFRTKYDAERDVTELEFCGARNYWENPEFAYASGSVPENYQYTGGISAVTGDNLGRALRGDRFLKLTGEGWVSQEIPTTELEAWTLSLYATSRSASETGSFGLSIGLLDQERREITSYGPYYGSVSPLTGDTTWTRFGIGIGHTEDLPPGHPGIGVEELAEAIALDNATRYLNVKILYHTGDVGIDCVQLEKGYEATTYTRLPRSTDMTVEYESSESTFYQVTDLTIHPVRNGKINGFLSIVPVAASQWDSEAPSGSTTLSDTWPDGRIEVLPWAKTEGYNKLNRVVDSRETRLAPPEKLASFQEPSYPAEIRVTPSRVIARQGSEGEDFAIEVVDENSNPYAFGSITVNVYDRTGEFPGYLSRREWNYFTQLGQEIECVLAEDGTQLVRWIPPDQEDIEYRGNKPSIETGQEWSYVDTRYPVYGPNHGSPAVRDQYNRSISVTGEILTGEFYGQLVNNSTLVSLDDFPIPGTIELYSDDTGGFAYQFEETFELPVAGYQYLTDYERGTITLAGDWTYPVRVVYQPRLVWKEPAYTNRLYLDASVLEQITGDLSIQYDAALNILVRASSPEGHPEAVDKWLLVEGIAQHRDRINGS